MNTEYKNEFRVTVRKSGGKSITSNRANRSYQLDTFATPDAAFDAARALAERYIKENHSYTRNYIIYVWYGDQLLGSKKVYQYKKEIEEKRYKIERRSKNGNNI